MFVILCKSTARTGRPGVISLISDEYGDAIIYQDFEAAQNIAMQKSKLGYFHCRVIEISQALFINA